MDDGQLKQWQQSQAPNSSEFPSTQVQWPSKIRIMYKLEAKSYIAQLSRLLDKFNC